MTSHNMIPLASVSTVRLGHFRAQQELARNFYDDQEFCPLAHIEEATEHRERIQMRTSPLPSPTYSYSASSCYYTSPTQCHSHQYYWQHQNYAHNTVSSRPSSANSTTGNKAIPIIDPSNMTPVAVPVHQQYSTTGSTSPSMAQWPAYNNNVPANFSPSSSHSSIGSSSSSASSCASFNSNSSSNKDINSDTSSYIPSNSNHHIRNNSGQYYFNNCAINYQYQIQQHLQQQQQRQIVPVVARAIPIINPTTRQVFRHQRHQQQSPNIPPGFYNVSVC